MGQTDGQTDGRIAASLNAPTPTAAGAYKLQPDGQTDRQTDIRLTLYGCPRGVITYRTEPGGVSGVSTHGRDASRGYSIPIRDSNRFE